MKLLDSLLLSSVVAFLIIGIYHTILHGIIYSYWLFMLVAFGLLWLNIRQQALPAKPSQGKEAKEKTKNKQSKPLPPKKK